MRGKAGASDCQCNGERRRRTTKMKQGYDTKTRHRYVSCGIAVSSRQQDTTIVLRERVRGCSLFGICKQRLQCFFELCGAFTVRLLCRRTSRRTRAQKATARSILTPVRAPCVARSTPAGSSAVPLQPCRERRRRRRRQRTAGVVPKGWRSSHLAALDQVAQRS
jgi:hypothetical protein